jgi:glycine/sarcosine N-methyltransferase
MMYDAFSTDYDRFVNWPSRLAAELPFIESQLRAAGARRVLDAACGTGQHAVALAKRGYTAAGADLSAGMVERARANAAAAGVSVQFATVGFGQLAPEFEGQRFDAVLCLGNSLPHMLSSAELAQALRDFAACLRPGGLLLVQNRNFEAVLARRERWMEPQAAREGEAEWLFLRFYDFDADGLLTFNVTTLRREGAGPWAQAVTSTRLRPLLAEELTSALIAAGFEGIVCLGHMSGELYQVATSANLVLTARRAAS